MRRLVEIILQFVSDFYDGKQNIIFDVLHKKTAKNCENHQRSYKITDLILRTLKIIIA
jgi:hypothetical protein